jgi:hypothetical protein
MEKEMRKWMAIAALLMAAACVSPEEPAAMDAAQQRADAQECQNLGFKPRTDAFGNCMLKLKEIRAQEANTDAVNRAANTPPPFWPYGPFGRPYW